MKENIPPLPVTHNFCFACGSQIDSRAEICPKCGVRQKKEELKSKTGGGKSRIAAALLAFFLGWAGFHKFYLDRNGQGILYLVFFWTGIPFILGFIECIIYLCTTDEAFAAKYG